jgi:ribosomal protein S21
METTMHTREEALKRFKEARERKRIVVEELKQELSESCERRTGKKPTSFFVL